MKVNFTRVEFDGSVICVFGTYPQIAGERRILTIPVHKDERTDTLIARMTTEAVEDLVKFINENLGAVNVSTIWNSQPTLYDGI